MINNLSYKSLLPLFLIIFIDSMGYFIAIPILIRVLSPESTLLAVSVDASTRHLLFSLALAILPLAAIISRPIIGYCSDRWGRKKILLFCLIGSAGGFLLPVWGFAVNSFVWVVLGRLVSGITASSQAIAQAAITDITSGKQKAFFLSINALCMTLAMASGSVLGGLLSDNQVYYLFSDSTPFLIAALLVFIAIILLWLFFPDEVQKKSRQKQQSLFASLQTLLASPKSKNIRLLLIIFFLLELGWSLYYQAAPLTFNEHYGTDPTTISLFMGYAGLWMCIGLGVVYAGLLRFTQLSHALLICMVLCAVALSLSGFLPEFNQQWLMAIPIVLGVGMAYPTLLTLMSNETEQQGGLMGLAGAALALAWLITGLFSGILVNIFSLLPLYIAGLTMLAALGLTIYWYKLKKYS